MKFLSNDKVKLPFRKIQVIVSACLTVLIMSSLGWATEYYVATNGNDANPGTLSSPWKTIGKANTTLKAGDTVSIRSGTYNQSISPSNSGTSSGRITYRSYNGEPVTISGVTYSIYLSGKSYITVDGINASTATRWIEINNGSSYNHINNATFTNLSNNDTYPYGIRIQNNSRYNIFKNITAGNCGSGNNGGVVGIGNNTKTDTCWYNVIEDCTLFNGGHYVIIFYSGYNILRNNLIYNQEWKVGGYGDRCIAALAQPGYGDYLVIEGNRFSYSGLPNDQVFSAHAQMNSNNCIVRKNLFYNANADGWRVSTWDSACESNNHRIYNNVFYHNGYRSQQTALSYGLSFMSYYTPAKGAVVVNNIFNGNKMGSITYIQSVDSKSLQDIRSNWLDANGSPGFVNTTIPSNPADITAPDLGLQANSPCIDAGQYLTTVTSPSGSGNTFQVSDATFFIDGWGIVDGDMIQLQGQAKAVEITKINYTTKEITIDQSISWKTGAGVSLPYSGVAPDLGAIETATSNTPKLVPPANLRIN